MRTRNRIRALYGVLLMAGITLIAYWPALRGGFIWDDDILLAKNPLIRAPDGLYRMWFTSEPIDYWPLTNSSFWLEWRLWKMQPTGYHVTNVALHIAAALLIWAILGKLAIPGAYLAALLFAVHPMNVESVAWIAQRKNTLAMVLFALSILGYLRAEELRMSARREGRGAVVPFWYVFSLLAFLLAMLSKGSVAILPLVLLLIAWWQFGRITGADLWRTAPFFLVAAALAGVNIWFQTHGLEEIRRTALPERLAGAGSAVWFYLAKALAPINVVFVYPQWRIHTGYVLWWLPTSAAVVATAVLLQQRTRTNPWMRALQFAWGVFVVALIPVLGFTDVYFMKFSLVADHYAYIALVAVAALAGAGWSAWCNGSQVPARAAANVSAFVIVGALTILTMQHSSQYANAMTLYQATLEKNPESWMVQNNLGEVLLHAGQPLEAMQHFERALRIEADFPEAQNNLSLALAKCGRLDEAIEQCRLALRLKPDFPEARNNLGSLLNESGQIPQAIAQLNESLRLRPDYAEAHYNLGLALANAGQMPAAIDQYELAVQLNPDYFEALNNLGTALNAVGRPQEAIERFATALRLNPDSAVIHYNLGLTLAGLGRTQQAAAQYQLALQLARAHGEDGLAQQIESRINASQANGQIPR